LSFYYYYYYYGVHIILTVGSTAATKTFISGHVLNFYCLFT